jgi:hypothetical protein
MSVNAYAASRRIPSHGLAFFIRSQGLSGWFQN